MKLRHRIEFTPNIFFYDKPTLSKKTCLLERGLNLGRTGLARCLQNENTLMKYTEIFLVVKIKKSVKKSVEKFCHCVNFVQNIDCGYTLEPPRLAEAVLTSTHNLCFEAFDAEIRQIGVSLYIPVLLYKSGV